MGETKPAWGRDPAPPFYATAHCILHPMNALTASGGWSFPLLAIVLSAAPWWRPSLVYPKNTGIINYHLQRKAS